MDAMLDNMRPEQFDEWVAYANLEPFDNGWMQSAIVACTVYNMVVTALYAHAGKRPKKTDLLDIEDFMPQANKATTQRQKRKAMSPEQIDAIFKSQVQKWQ